MEGSRSVRRPHGRTVRGPGGYRAFVPAPLPLPISWDAELVGALSRADQAIGRLEAAGIVSLVGSGKRNRVYCARAMLEILEAPHAVGRPASALDAGRGEAR